MLRLLFFQRWSWVKVGALCLAWLVACLLMYAWRIGTPGPVGPNEFVYYVHIHFSVGAWLILFGPVALIVFIRWQASQR